MTTTRRQSALRWLPTFIGFPVGGLVAELVAGPVDGLVAALLAGAITGVVLGTVAQAFMLRGRAAYLWAPALSALWAVGWAITTSIGVDVETQYAVFGSSGALVVTAATAVLPVLLATRARRSAS